MVIMGTVGQETRLPLVFAPMLLRYDAIQLSLSNPRARVSLASLLSPILRLEAVAQNDRESYLFAEPFASYSSLGKLRNRT